MLGSGTGLTVDLDTDLLGGEEAIEGQLPTFQHQRRERSRKIVTAKKAAVLKALGKLICEVCHFDFEMHYGKRGKDFIECHHIKPVAERGDATPTRLADLALVCANCHRMVHAQRPWLTVDELRTHVQSQSA